MSAVARLRTFDRGETMRVPLAMLRVYGRVQRSLNPRNVDKIAGALNADAIGVITVNLRADGTYSIVDGQHRVAALKAAGSDEPVLCHVHRGLSEAEEAALFRALNTSTKVSIVDDFRVGVTAGDPECVGIQKILSKHHLKVGLSSGSNVISAIGRVQDVYRGKRLRLTEPQPQVLDMLLTVLSAAWGENSDRTHRDLVGGIGAALLKHHDVIEESGLVRTLAKWDGGPLGLIGSAAGIRSYRGGTSVDAVAEAVIDAYNKRRTSNRLPAWRS